MDTDIIGAPQAWVSPPTAYAEWLELLALARWPLSAGQSDIRALLEGAADDFTEQTGSDAVDEASEQAIQAAFDEFSRRIAWSAGGYPFDVRNGQITFRAKNGAHEAQDRHLAYALSLLITYLRQDFNKRFGNKKKLPRSKKAKLTFPRADEIEDLFQIVGTIASAGFLGGAHSISFGFPRPDGTSFYEALRSAGTRLGEGAPGTVRLSGAPGKPKDGAVDLIAWRPCPDGHPGQIYLIGQCASGDNWVTSKTPINEVNEFHRLYWTRPPCSRPIVATFLPFDFRNWADRVDHPDPAESWKWTRWNLAGKYGVVVDRFRLASYFDRGLKIARWSKYKVDGVDSLPDVSGWISEALTFLKKLA